MKKSLLLIACSLIIGIMAGCGKGSGEIETYQKEVTDFFTEMEDYNTKINELNPEDSDSVESLFAIFDEMEASYKALSEVKVPEEFSANETLAKQASEYMTQANQYFHDSFTDTSYNEYTLEAAMECYRRANKRLGYMVDILHGKIPDDESITVK
jgi:hypothetical protein